MRSCTKFILVVLSLALTPLAASANCTGLLDFEAKQLHSSKTVNFCEKFSDKVLLVVNTASQCGFTPQFKELEALYQKYKDQGLEIVGFPSNDFRQEYKSEAETASVCYKNFGVTFTMVAPSSVKGYGQNPFFKNLTQKVGTSPNWNFNKYLISQDLAQIEHYGSSTMPLGSVLENQIIKALNTKQDGI